MQTKKKVLFIINPISGPGNHRVIDYPAFISNAADKSLIDFDIVETKAPQHATELSSNAAKEGFDIVVGVGGDGTIHEVGIGLIGTKTALGIFPKGSGNGLARNMNISMNLFRAFDVIHEAKTIKIDTVNINNKNFLGVAGMGFDALVAWKFAELGKRGLKNYVKIVLNEFKKFKSESFLLEINGERVSKNAFMLTFANSAQFGNNAIISPQSSITDGLIDICVMHSFPSHMLPTLALRLFTNTLDKSRYMEVIKASSFKVWQKNDFVHLDGEPFRMENEVNISVNPLSLNVVVPGFKKRNKITL